MRGEEPVDCQSIVSTRYLFYPQNAPVTGSLRAHGSLSRDLALARDFNLFASCSIRMCGSRVVFAVLTPRSGEFVTLFPLQPAPEGRGNGGSPLGRPWLSMAYSSM